jgi:aspartate kinase
MLEEFAQVRVEGDLALLCAVGDNLRAQPRLAARLIGALEEFPLRMVSHAASRRNITVVLSERDLAPAMTRLHEEFFAAAVGPDRTE